MVVTLASGSRAALRYVREGNRGETPVLTAITTIAAAVGGTGTSNFTRATGSFVTDGFAVGQTVVTAGFTTGANNGTWIVSAVAALTLTVIDAADAIQAEAADVSQSIRIQMHALRATGRNVNLEKNILESAEVDADGQETDVRHGFNRVVGSPGFQLSMTDYDDIIEMALGGTWQEVDTSTAPGAVGTGVGSTGTGTFTRASGSWITDGVRPGDIIRATGFANANGDWRVLTVAALTLTVYDPNDTIGSEAASGSMQVVVPGKRIDLTPTMKTMSVERAFLDVSQFQVFEGVCVDQIQFNVQPEAMIGGSINLLGMSANPLASSAAGVVLASTGSSPFAAFDGEIFEGSTAIAVATSVEATLQRNRSLNPVIGSRFSPDVFDGQAQLNGTLTAYFQDATMFNKFVNETESSIYFKFRDPNDSASFISIVYYRVKYTGAQMDPPQQGPVPMQMPFKAVKETGLNAIGGGTAINTIMSIQRSNA